MFRANRRIAAAQAPADDASIVPYTGMWYHGGSQFPIRPQYGFRFAGEGHGPPAGVRGAQGSGGMRASALRSFRMYRTTREIYTFPARETCVGADSISARVFAPPRTGPIWNRPLHGGCTAAMAAASLLAVGEGFIPPAGVCGAAGGRRMRASRPTVVPYVPHHPGNSHVSGARNLCRGGFHIRPGCLRRREPGRYRIGPYMGGIYRG